MSSGKSVAAAQADPLADLQRALCAADAVLAHASCSALGVPPEHRERFTAQAQRVVQTAVARVPAASGTEVALALGVLVALFTEAPAPAELG